MLFIASGILLFTAFYFYLKRQTGYAVMCLAAMTVMLRFALSLDDLYLNNWDERFHALVAKNMMNAPFKPTLRIDPALPYDHTAWWDNTIWLHKPPLFLWQIALSMSIFGANEFALRLPSVLMGGFWVLLVYRIAWLATKSKRVSFVAAYLAATNYFTIEQSTGVEGQDHNDAAFLFYVTASIWSYCEYTIHKTWRWVFAIGAFAGCAVLVKWLPGLMIYAVWIVTFLLSKPDREKRGYYQLAVAAATSLLIFLPWQIYIHKVFPEEAARELQAIGNHFFSALEGHDKPWYFHFAVAVKLYGLPLLVCFVIGICRTAFFKPAVLTTGLIFLIGAVYAFYSMAATKVAGYTFPLAGMVILFSAIGIDAAITSLRLKKPQVELFVFVIVLATFGLFGLKPWKLADTRSNKNTERNAKLHNTEVFKALPDSFASQYIVFNCKEQIEFMFYCGGDAYGWYPAETTIDSLKANGQKIATFVNTAGQPVPDYMIRKSNVLIKTDLR